MESLNVLIITVTTTNSNKLLIVNKDSVEVSNTIVDQNTKETTN